MKKLLVLLLFIPIVSVRAAASADPFKPGLCDNNGEDPAESTICHVRYDVVNSVIKLDQVDTTIAQTSLIGVAKIANMIWNGIVKPSGNSYAIGTTRSVPYGNQVESSAFEDLRPAKLQDVTVKDTTPKRYCVTSRLCVADPTTGKLSGNFITDEEWCTQEDVPGLNALTQGNQAISSYVTRYEQPSANFTKPEIKTKKLTAPSCSERSSGDTIDQPAVSSINQNIYGKYTDAKTSIPYTITGDMQTETTKRDIFGQILSVFTAKFPVPATHVAGGMLPWQGNNLCLGPGCPNGTDLDPITYLDPEQKKTLQDAGGFINAMYRPQAIDANYTVGRDATFTNQPFEVSLLKKTANADTTVYALRRVDEAQTYMNCTLLNDSLQSSSLYLAGQCNKSWTPQNAPENIAASPPSVPDTSTWASSAGGSSANPISPRFSTPSPISSNLVPACVLEGIAKIEGAYDGNAPCKRNECGAYGPFQITTGQCTSACRASSCPNAANGASLASLCNFSSASQIAARLLVGKAKYFGYTLSTADPKTQKDAIIIAGDSYYGTTKPIARLGGLSYGEWVYSHCDSTYTTHVDHQFPK